MSAQKRSPKALPPEEWDFRSLPEQTDLQTVIEYEYLRSSPLRAAIEEWHSQPFADTSLATRAGSFRFLREAGIVKFTDQSPLGKLQAHREHPDILDVEEAMRLEERARRQISTLERSKLTIRQVIRAIFHKVKEKDAIESLLLGLDLPHELAEKHADDIALRFDCFPRPWLDVIKTEGEEYLAKRIERVPPTVPAMWEIVHAVHGTAMVGVEPGFRTAMFVIDWSRSLHDITKEFNLWVSERHSGGAAGRKIAERWLTKLAAYRLNREAGNSYREAIKLVQKRKDDKPGANWDTLPSSLAENNWSRQVNTVKKLLNEDFIEAIRKDFGKLTLNLP